MTLLPARRPAPRRAPLLGASALWLALAASCSDATGPGTGADAPRLVLSVSDAGAAAGDSLGQQALGLTVALRDSAPFRLLRVYVDSATRPTPDQDVDYTQPYGYTRTATSIVVYAPAAGRHVITVAVTDTGGRVASASLNRTFAVPAAAYTLTPLPDLGADARGADLRANGDAAGWVATDAGRKRPAVWRAGRLTVLPVTDSVDVAARRRNGAGDVLLQYDYPYSYGDARRRAASVRVWRSDGTLMTLGPAHYTTPSGDTTTFPVNSPGASLTGARRPRGPTAPIPA